jgi:hypothetical protein
MHTEIETVLNSLSAVDDTPNAVTLANAERLLNYIEDINLERSSKFELTPANSLYLLWTIDEWEIHIECLHNGRILYTFRNAGYGKASGTASIDVFIPLLEQYLLSGIC